MISSDADFKKPELTYDNLTTTKFQLPMEKLETGKMYYVGVSLVDNGKYVSSPAGPIILETPVPAKDMIGEKKFNLQVYSHLQLQPWRKKFTPCNMNIKEMGSL